MANKSLLVLWWFIRISFYLLSLILIGWVIYNIQVNSSWLTAKYIFASFGVGAIFALIVKGSVDFWEWLSKKVGKS